MKYLLSSIMILSLSLTSFINAEEGPVYEPNVAEYYVSSFKENKDMDDMMKWAENGKNGPQPVMQLSQMLTIEHQC